MVTDENIDFPGGTNGKEPSGNAGDLRDGSSTSGLGRSPEEEHGNPLQYSCLENPTGTGLRRLTLKS